MTWTEMNPELKLPKKILDQAIKSGNEYGWKKDDVLNVIEAARKVRLATIGGQVQYALPDGICELYWLTYDSSERRESEDWAAYCDRSANECSEKFKQLLATDIQARAVETFPKWLTNAGKIIDNLNDYQLFILYFNDEKTYEIMSK